MKKYIFILFIALLVSSDSLWACAESLTPNSREMPNSKQKVIKKSLSESALFELDNYLDLALDGGPTRLIKKLLEAGANVNHQGYGGWTALMAASDNGQIEAVRALLAAGADVNLQNKKGRTALMYASENGHTEIVRLLLENGAKVNYQDDHRWTALILADSKGHVEIVRLLKAAGATE